MFPTLCELAGIPIPKTVQTKGFRDSLLDPTKPARKIITCAYTEEMRAYRDDRYKIILYNNHVAQLFDLKTDPLESHDLAKNSEYTQLLVQLIDQARAGFKIQGDFAGKKVANIYRRWPMKACRLPKDGQMLWEVWDTSPMEK